jgi:16S rRNA (guanine527-N7)-methyltransferase
MHDAVKPEAAVSAGKAGSAKPGAAASAVAGPVVAGSVPAESATTGSADSGVTNTAPGDNRTAGGPTAGGPTAGGREASSATAGSATAGSATTDGDTIADGESLAAVEAAAAAMFGGELARARRYAELLTGAGVERGVVGPAEAERIWDRHLLNCGAVARLIPTTSSLLDLGSGAGLPGIVLALLLPGANVTLLEPMARRVDFLTECVADLKLANATVLRGRAEDLAGHVSADVVTARAVAPLDRLAGLMLGLMRPGGRALAIKGATAETELARSRPALARLGISDAKIVHAAGPTARPDSEVSSTSGPPFAVPATTVVMFTAPDHRGTAQSGRAAAHGLGRPGGSSGGAPRSGRGTTGGRRSRPNSRRGGG